MISKNIRILSPTRKDTTKWKSSRKKAKSARWSNTILFYSKQKVSPEKVKNNRRGESGRDRREKSHQKQREGKRKRKMKNHKRDIGSERVEQTDYVWHLTWSCDLTCIALHWIWIGWDWNWIGLDWIGIGIGLYWTTEHKGTNQHGYRRPWRCGNCRTAQAGLSNTHPLSAWGCQLNSPRRTQVHTDLQIRKMRWYDMIWRVMKERNTVGMGGNNTEQEVGFKYERRERQNKENSRAYQCTVREQSHHGRSGPFCWAEPRKSIETLKEQNTTRYDEWRHERKRERNEMRVEKAYRHSSKGSARSNSAGTVRAQQ